MANVLIRRMAGLVVSPIARPTLLSVTSSNATVCTRSLSVLPLMSATSPHLSRQELPVHQTCLSKPQFVTNDYVMMTSNTNHGFSSLAAAKSTSVPTSKQPKPGEIITTDDGRRYAVINTKYRPLKPSIVRRRLEKMKIYEGRERNVKYSPWKMRLICELVSGMPLLDALEQLSFNHKAKSPLVHKILKRTSNLADIRDGLQMSQLEVAECFATKGRILKGITFHAKGRFGKKFKRYSHLRIVLREIDFPLRIYQARSIYQKKTWIRRQLHAEKEAEVANIERDELARLEKQASLKVAQK